MNYGDVSSIPFLHSLGVLLVPFVLIVLVWTIIIKGIALWRSARGGHKVWFVVLLIVNTLGILELVYLLLVSKNERPGTTPTGPQA